MTRSLSVLLRDESGFIISAELVLIATILVIGMIVGVCEIQHAVVQELNDVGDAIASLNQSFFFSGFSARKGFVGNVKSFSRGSGFVDVIDVCDWNQCDLTCSGPVPEGAKVGGFGFGGRFGFR